MALEPTLEINAGLHDLARIRRFLREQARALQVKASAVYDLLLAVTEMVTNTLVHGYQEEHGWIAITLRAEGDSLVVTISDRAPPFDPTQAPVPDTHLPLEDRSPGGMGIHLTRHTMDSITHQVTSEGGNRLILVKKAVITPKTEDETQ
jgi:serine/threonine-protein kinase RsbW